MNFTHLHAHSEHSQADGLFSVGRWAKAYKDRGYLGAALTDHGTMSGLLAFHKAMKEQGLVGIMGVEFYFSDTPTIKTAETRKNSHVILLAKNYDGFRNLMKLSRLSYTDGFYYKPRIGLEWMTKYSEGLVCLTACQGGILANQLWAEKKGRESIGLEAMFATLKVIYGDDFYIEAQPHSTISKNEDGSEFDSQVFINQGLQRLSKLKGFKQIITNDCHYILPEHAKIQKTIKDISWGGKSDAGGDSATVTKDHFTDSLWLMDAKQIFQMFRKHHEYLPMDFVADGMLNTMEVFEKCKDFQMPTGKRYLPTYKQGVDSKQLFGNLLGDKLSTFLKSDRLRATKKEYVERFKKEYEVISKYHLEDYFLVVWDLIRFADERGIYIGIGRGSSAGCLISYLLGIVKVDPLEYGLLFERFLNENRCVSGELPDIDLDTASDGRGEIKQYIYDTYGEDHVCEIGTYGRMKLKTALIDFGKAMGVATQQELLAITTKIDLDKDAPDDIDAAAEADPRLKALMLNNPQYAISVADIIGQIKSQGIHPAGVIICSEPISDITPVKTQTKTFKPEEIVDGGEKSRRVITTQSEDKYCIAQGLMKLDLLGLKEYDVIRYVIDNAPGCPFTRENYIDKIMDAEREKPNKLVWQMFQDGLTASVFQFSGGGMQGLLKMMQPDCVNDLVAANALYRPGSLDNGWHIQYCDRKNGTEVFDYLHEDIENATKNTYGLFIYQEQTMQIFHKLGGVSLIDSDNIRSALGKKDKKKLSKYKRQFVDGASKKIGEIEAERLWNQLEKGSGYLFNLSHSVVYSVLAYISQYFKAHYPAHFWAAQIDWDIRKNKLDDMLQNKRSAAEMGVKFVLPNVNKSKAKIYVKHDRVYWSLESVKGIGLKVAREIEAHQPYDSFKDFYTRVNKTTVKHNNIQSLIFAGAFDDFGDRKDLLRVLSSLKKGAKHKEFTEEELMRKFHDTMGFFERKVKDVRPDFSATCMTEQDIKGCVNGDDVLVGGMITSVRAIKTKKGDAMGFVTLMDLDEIIEVTVFPKVWDKCRPLINLDAVVEVSGKKSTHGGKDNLIEANNFIVR